MRAPTAPRFTWHVSRRRKRIWSSAPDGGSVSLLGRELPLLTAQERRGLRGIVRHMFWEGGVPLRLLYGTYDIEDEFDLHHGTPMIPRDGRLDPRMDQMPLYVRYNGDRATWQSAPFDWATGQDRNCYSWSPNHGKEQYMIMAAVFDATERRRHFEVIWFCRDDVSIGPHFFLPFGSGYYGITLEDALLLDQYDDHREGVRHFWADADWDTTGVEALTLSYLSPSTMKGVQAQQKQPLPLTRL